MFSFHNVSFVTLTSKKGMRNTRSGFTLIEALVLLFIFSVVSVTFFQTYTIGTRLILDSKNRLGATAFANQKMEIIRSIDYDTLGTKHMDGGVWVYGVPAGDLLQEEDVTTGATTYHIETFVQYIDDPFDGTAGLGTDAIPNDYKRVRLTVSWGDRSSARTVGLISTVSPNGIETSAGGGVLTINILDAGGAGVTGANVHIVGSSTSINTNATTDSTGNVTLPGTPASTPLGSQDYTISVSKSGYYGATTLLPYAVSETYDPVDEDMSVVADALNPITIVMDRASDIILHTKDPFGTAIPNVNFSLVGGRILGNSVPPGTFTYGFPLQNTQTDGSGNKTFANESYGQYTLTNSPVAPYEFFKFDPPETVAGVLNVAPGVNKETTMVYIDTSIASAKIQVTNNTDGAPIVGASVKLSNTILGYDVTLTTDENGFVYFPSALPALTPDTYTIDITAPGFADKTDTITIVTSLARKTITLESN